ncbi:MAG: ergothioneine biosynthesis protein EgtB [Pseudomonadota bacterium]
MAAAAGDAGLRNDPLTGRFDKVRARSLALCETLSAEDQVVQTMPDVSPTKWHLAHTTWFFETFVLVPHAPGYAPFDPRFAYLFNSYYQSAGEMHARPRRGLLSRPTVAEVHRYRAYVDDAMQSLLATGVDAETCSIIELGLHHEQQHQELMLTDIKHVLWCNPLKPAMCPDLPVPAQAEARATDWIRHSGGEAEIGAPTNTRGFCFDNETPRHRTLLQPHQIADRLVTNADYRRFVEDGGYGDAMLWLSDGWATVTEEGWCRPLYWSEDLEQEFTLGGLREIDPNAPVSHLSFYEADAFASWAGARLPTEAEWETAAGDSPVQGNFAESGYWHPAAGDGPQWYGDVWEWTASPYAAYPGFKPLAGTLGEYNGKFMCSQLVIRGGSCLSAQDHLRPTYRSFFYPDARWQCTGLRLAGDA